MLEVDPKLLAERARLGHDRWDEMWDGELHMVPPPSFGHQLLGTRLLLAIAPLADARGLTMTYETGYFRVADDYRQPDLAVFRLDRTSARGIEVAELVIEIRSPGDESNAKIAWYLAQGCREVLIVDRDTLDIELHTATGRRDPAASEVLDCTFETADGPVVRVTWADSEAIVAHS